jgi:hypothetical protein
MLVEMRPIGSNKLYEQSPCFNNAAVDGVEAPNETGFDSVN